MDQANPGLLWPADDFDTRHERLESEHEALLGRPNERVADTNGVIVRYAYPVLTAPHTPLFWRYDLNPAPIPF